MNPWAPSLIKSNWQTTRVNSELSICIEHDDGLITLLDKLHFSCRKLLNSNPSDSTSAPGKEPKRCPTFDDDPLNWKQFWEQFTVNHHTLLHVESRFAMTIHPSNHHQQARPPLRRSRSHWMQRCSLLMICCVLVIGSSCRKKNWPDSNCCA